MFILKNSYEHVFLRLRSNFSPLTEQFFCKRRQKMLLKLTGLPSELFSWSFSFATKIGPIIAECRKGLPNYQLYLQMISRSLHVAMTPAAEGGGHVRFWERFRFMQPSLVPTLPQKVLFYILHGNNSIRDS